MKSILIILGLLLLIGCHKNVVEYEELTKKTQYFSGGLEVAGIIEIDSCEYVFWKNGNAGGLTHKGNCKYCIERIKER